MEGLPLLKHAMKEKVLMITIDLKVIAFVRQWANSINPFLGFLIPFCQPSAPTLFIKQQNSNR